MTFTPLTARLKKFLMGWLMVLGLKEGLVECETLCIKSEVILGVAHTLQRKRKEKRFWVFPGKEIWHIIRSVIESMIYKGSLYITKT